MSQANCCEKCGLAEYIGWFPFCRGNHQDHIKGPSHRFTPVEVDLGSGGKHTIHSFADFARLEKQSRDRGQEISFRAFNNNSSNYDSNSMGENEQVKFNTRSRRGVPYITRKG